MFHKRGPFNPTACFATSEIWAVGDNTNGQLGDLTVVDKTSPIQVSGYSWQDVASGICFALATCNDGTLWSWGLNTNGQLGQNARSHRSSPVQIPGTSWQSVSAGASHSLATRNDGTLWAWGLAASGQLGDNTIAAKSSPVQIPGTDWAVIDASSCNTLALRTDNTLWAWGDNTLGQLGQNNRVHRSSPTQIPGTTWCSLSVGGSSAAIKTDNTLWMWGNNTAGQLGQSDVARRSSPTQIPGTDWCSVKTALNHTLALKTDNTLWSWGNNANGRLGINSVSARSSPVQIPGTDWCEIFTLSNGDVSFAKRTDGTLWAWGLNTAGLLGDATITSKSSPTQIPGTGWKNVNASSTNTYLMKNDVVINGTYDGNDLGNVWANDSNTILITPSTTAEFNDDLYARDFRFCMGPKSKIIEANVITRIKSTSSGGNLYGGTSNGWYKIQLIDNNGDIGSDLGDKSASGWSNSWSERFAKISNPSITPSQVTSNTFGVRLGALSTGSPVPIMCIDSVHISLTTENSANAVSQGSQLWQWNNIGDVI